ncbi:MAG: SH3 domain-containing protein [Chloroflexi bacterium]|nr:SH3 domain-containing protein [Chloroflexota bacterium]
MSRDVQIPWGNLSFSWGETHEEVWLEGFFWDGPLLDWILLQPRIELPPFSDELSFRVAGTVDCLILRESHLAGSSAIACLPNGTRVSQGARDWPYAEDPRDWPGGLGPIYVRTDDGLEGWVATDYLEHD